MVMNALGLSLIVAGLAFLFSGLIFLLPTERKLFKQVESFEESQKELDDRLDQLRNQRVSHTQNEQDEDGRHRRSS
jgi:hypothetical protein